MVDESHLFRIEQIVRPQYHMLTNWAHAWPHVERVGEHAKELAGLVGADPLLCQIAAYCHDLGRVVEETSQGSEKTELGNTDHSLDSIEPTVNVLRDVGIEGYSFNAVVGAVTVHSDKLYHGRNLVAKVLRDSDKKESLGPWGSLRHVRHHFSRDLVDTNAILEGRDSSERIIELAEKTLNLVKKDDSMRRKYLKVLDFVLAWVDNEMMDNPEAYDFVRPEYEFTRQSREFLLE